LINLPRITQFLQLVILRVQILNSFRDIPSLVYFFPAFFQPLYQRFIIIVLRYELHRLLTLSMVLKSCKRPIERKCLFLILISRELLFKSVINIKYMMLNSKIIPFKPLFQSSIIVINNIKFQGDFLLTIVIFELQISEHWLGFLVVLQIIEKAFSFHIVT
jgi:hypothetical protein